MATLTLIGGAPGSGKTTWLKNNIKDKNAVIISRDEIRFSIVKPDEDYFSHEDEVCEIFWDKINKALAENKNVFVDQTSLTPRARKWLLQHVTGYDTVEFIWLDVDLNTCLNRNENRKGTRAYVPRGVIRRMFMQFIPPSLDEGFNKIHHIIDYKGGKF